MAIEANFNPKYTTYVLTDLEAFAQSTDRVEPLNFSRVENLIIHVSNYFDNICAYKTTEKMAHLFNDLYIRIQNIDIEYSFAEGVEPSDIQDVDEQVRIEKLVSNLEVERLENALESLRSRIEKAAIKSGVTVNLLEKEAAEA